MKPILFNTEMVLAILDGRKTQTRRVVKFPDGMTGRLPRDGTRNILFYPGGIKHPPYMPGEIMYVRETWGFFPCSDCEQPDDCKEQTGHKPDTLKVDGEQVDGCLVYRANYGTTEDDSFPPSVFKWRPSIHMPKEAARIFLRVKNVYAERLQKSFSEPIAPIFAVMAEGVDVGETCRTCIEAYGMPCCVDEMDDDGTTHGECGLLDEARGDFSDLWDSTIKPAERERCGWAANPWVWVIEFERCEKPESEKQ